MTFEGDVRDARSIARMINLAYRFGCPPDAIAADPADGVTRVRMTFRGAAPAVSRLLAQISKLVADEHFA